MNEHWRDVIGYSGYYQVSDLGRVRSVDRVVPDKRCTQRLVRGRILRPAPVGRGHLAVSLWKNGIGRTIHVHQLVATAWIGPGLRNQIIRHGSNGKLDNSVSNLCYGTRSEDQLDRRRDGTHNGVSIRRSDGIEFINMQVAADAMKCTSQAIWNACNGRQHTVGGFGWEYI